MIIMMGMVYNCYSTIFNPVVTLKYFLWIFTALNVKNTTKEIINRIIYLKLIEEENEEVIIIKGTHKGKKYYIDNDDAKIIWIF